MVNSIVLKRKPCLMSTGFSFMSHLEVALAKLYHQN